MIFRATGDNTIQLTEKHKHMYSAILKTFAVKQKLSGQTTILPENHKWTGVQHGSLNSA